MVKKTKSSDINVTAVEILKAVTGESDDHHSRNGTPAKQKDPPKKNPAVVALGRLGGMKGGKARAAKLNPKRRNAIALKVARARWGPNP